jgi:hypothetical protein
MGCFCGDGPGIMDFNRKEKKKECDKKDEGYQVKKLKKEKRNIPGWENQKQK